MPNPNTQNPSNGRNKWKDWKERYVGALVAVGTFIPISMCLLTALIYFCASYGYFPQSNPIFDWLKYPPSIVWLSLIIMILGLFSLPLLFMRLATAERGKLSDYKLICGDLKVLEAQFNEVKRRKSCIAQPQKEPECLTIAEIETDIAYLNDQLTQNGIIWLLRTGYIRVWDRINRVVEAMIDVLPSELVIARALYAMAQLSSSTIPKNLHRIKQLKIASDTLRSVSGSSTGSVDEQKARSDIRQIIFIINTYRCERWEGLVRARNQLLGTAWLASWLLYTLLSTAILALGPLPLTRTTMDTMYEISGFLLLGAIIGLFDRLLNEVHPNDTAITYMDDYGLTAVRIMVTPFLSALAVLVGVPLTAIALTMLQKQSLALSLPGFSITDCYNFYTYPGYLLIAAIFGYLPSAVISLLKQQAQKVQSELVSSSPASR